MTAIEFQHKLLNLESSLERFAYSLTINREDAKDLVQETFLKALIYRDKFVHNDNFKAWTYTIMKNTFINNYRRNARKNTHRDQTKESYFLNHQKLRDMMIRILLIQQWNLAGILTNLKMSSVYL